MFPSLTTCPLDHYYVSGLRHILILSITDLLALNVRLTGASCLVPKETLRGRERAFRVENQDDNFYFDL